MHTDYYVYEWFNQDTGYIFYVGKGRKDRCKQTSKTKRNKYFIRYYNKHNCDYRIIVSNLMEDEALVFENEIILKYRKLNYCCCNFDDGGRNGGKSVGKNNGMYGKTISDYARKLVLKRFSKAVLQLDLDDNIINRFSSASEAERYLNGKGSHVSCCCLGKRKTAYGYRWKYE